MVLNDKIANFKPFYVYFSEMNLPKGDPVQFQSYIDQVKNGKIPWPTFVTVMKDLCQTLPTAKDLNSVLINELKNFIEPNQTKPNLSG